MLAFMHGETTDTLKRSKVFVYYNLHKHCFSVKALQGVNKGRVVAHTSQITLDNGLPRVSEAGRQRVITEGRKNVHAGIVGNVRGFDLLDSPKGCPITYNPFKHNTFVFTETLQPLQDKASFYLFNKKVLQLV